MCGNCTRYQHETKWVIGGPGEARTLDLMTARQSKLGYLVDFAARLATLEHAKARREHSSGTDLVLVFVLFVCHKNPPIAGEIANQIATMKCNRSMAATV